MKSNRATSPNLRQQPDGLHPDRQVAQAGRPGEPGGVLGGQREGARDAVVVDDPPGGHHRQPFPHVALVEPGPRGDRVAGRRGHAGHDVEQPGAVAHAHHQRHRGLVHMPSIRLAKSLGSASVTPET
jgi:hypothetical protein